LAAGAISAIMLPVPQQLLALSVLLLFAAGPAAGADFSAGAAKRRITPELKPGASVWMAGFANGRAATGVHDDLWIRCLAMSAGAKPVVICGVDAIGLFFEDVKKIREGARAALKREVDVIVAATHVHEGPDTMGLWGPQMGVSGIDEAYNQFVVDRTVEAVSEAVAGMRPAAARAAGVSPADVRRFFDDDRPPNLNDPEVLVLAVDDAQGRRLATLVNWASHPEALGSRNTLVTADWPWALVRDVEQAAGGLALFVNGAIGGMQSPLGAALDDPRTGRPAPATTFRFAEIVGEYVARQVLDACKKAKAVPVSAIEYREEIIEIPVSNQGYLMASAAGVFKGRKPMSVTKSTFTPVGFLQLAAGGKPVLQAAMIPGELYPELSVGGIARDPGADFPDAPEEQPIKRMMAAPVKMLFGLANDEIGYILPKAQWDEKPPFTFGAQKRWYGEVNSVGPEAAPIIAGALSRLISGGGRGPGYDAPK
jgi:hypothetical protein